MLKRGSTRAPEGRLGAAALIALAGSLITLLAMPVSAAEAAPGLRVTRDPVTGKLRAPTAEEVKALEAAAARARAAAKPGPPLGLITRRPNPAPIEHADGSTELELDDSTLSYSVATRQPDGSTNMVCVTGGAAAREAMKGRKTAESSKGHVHDQQK